MCPTDGGSDTGAKPSYCQKPLHGRCIHWTSSEMWYTRVRGLCVSPASRYDIIIVNDSPGTHSPSRGVARSSRSRMLASRSFDCLKTGQPPLGHATTQNHRYWTEEVMQRRRPTYLTLKMQCTIAFAYRSTDSWLNGGPKLVLNVMAGGRSDFRIGTNVS